mgnify:CR=1 FL=1
MKFEFGDSTTKIWAGEFVHTCEFISHYHNGTMIFYDIDSKVFRLVYWEYKDTEFTLNGWKCYNSLQDLLKSNK